MNEQNIVALFDSTAHAEAAVRDLKAANVPDGAITQHARSASTSSTETTGASAPAEHKGFWSSLFGGGESERDRTTDHYAPVYERSIESGSTVVTARVPEQDVDRISAILEKHNPIDLDERAAQYGASETATTRTTTAPLMDDRAAAATAPNGRATPATTMEDRGTAAPVMDSGRAAGSATDGGKMSLSEETLSVGKRAVSGGTTRIRRYVVETPVEEQVALHTEKVTMERHPVTDGRVGAGDFTDKTIEMTETSEEAVVSKAARVKEEISLRKEATEHMETVKDTVRHEDVKVEQVPGNQTTRTPENASAMPPAEPASKI